MRVGRAAVAAAVLAMVASGCTTIVRSNVASDGTAPAPGFVQSTTTSISDDGRYVAFTTSAALVPSDNNDLLDGYRRDNQSGTTLRVSVTDAETQIAALSVVFAISGNGDHVVFQTDAALEPSDTNGGVDVYVRSVTAGTTERVSVRTDGSSIRTPNIFDTLDEASISDDGRFVFMRYGPAGGGVELYVRDRTMDTTTHVAPGYISGILSGDGKHVVAGCGANGAPCSTTPELFTTAGVHEETIAGPCSFIAHDVSPDARYVVGQMSSALPVTCLARLVRWDRVTKAFTNLPAIAGDPTISDDGRFVAFVGNNSSAEVVDLATGESQRADADTWGQTGGWEPTGAAMSGNGRYIAFTTRSGLVPEDTNDATDVYTRYAWKPAVSSVVPATAARGAAHLAVTITGGAFLSGATAAVAGTGVTVNSVTLQSPTQLTADISVAPNAPVGARNVVVSNTGGFGHSDALCAGCLTIT